MGWLRRVADKPTKEDVDHEQQKVEVIRLASEMERLSFELTAKARALLKEVGNGYDGRPAR